MIYKKYLCWNVMDGVFRILIVCLFFFKGKWRSSGLVDLGEELVGIEVVVGMCYMSEG